MRRILPEIVKTDLVTAQFELLEMKLSYKTRALEGQKSHWDGLEIQKKKKKRKEKRFKFSSTGLHLFPGLITNVFMSPNPKCC